MGRPPSGRDGTGPWAGGKVPSPADEAAQRLNRGFVFTVGEAEGMDGPLVFVIKAFRLVGDGERRNTARPASRQVPLGLAAGAQVPLVPGPGGATP